MDQNNEKEHKSILNTRLIQNQTGPSDNIYDTSTINAMEIDTDASKIVQAVESKIKDNKTENDE